MKNKWFLKWIAALVIANLFLILGRSLTFPALDRSLSIRIVDYIRFQYHFDAGLCSLVLDDKAAALQHFRIAHLAEPTSSSGKMHFTRLLQWLGSEYLNQNNGHQAAKYFDELYTTAPENPAAIIFRASTGMRIPDTDSQDLQRDVIQKQDWSLAMSITEKWVKLGLESSEFLPWLTEICSGNPSVVWLSIFHGDVLWMSNQPREAYEAYKHALHIGAKNRYLTLRIGFLACLELGMPQLACQYFDQTFTDDPDFMFNRNEAIVCCPFITNSSRETITPTVKSMVLNLRHEQEILLTHLIGFWRFLDRELMDWRQLDQGFEPEIGDFS